MLSQADGDHGRVALAVLDSYVHADLFMTPTAALADVGLPVATKVVADGAAESVRYGWDSSVRQEYWYRALRQQGPRGRTQEELDKG